MNIVGEWMLHDGLEKVYGVTTGLVKNNWDDKHPGMIQAEYFLGTAGKNVTGWIPVAMPYAYKDCGMYALAEIGSEVVIAFNMGDRNCPIAIGCLWNKKNPLPSGMAAEKNNIKCFRTKGGCEVLFNDEKDKETIGIHTPAGMMLEFDDGKKTAAILDKDKKNGILIELAEGNVTVLAEKKMTFKIGEKEMLTLDGASGTLTEKADAIRQEAARGFSLKAQNTKIEGTQTDISADSQLSMQSGGVAQLKGATVKIN